MSKETEVAIAYDEARLRSGGHCEAMVPIDSSEGTIWARCGDTPVEIHHRITRARGGMFLDWVGESYHLMALCRSHHNMAHDQDYAIENGLLLEGYVNWSNNYAVYTGPDEHLKERYGKQ